MKALFLPKKLLSRNIVLTYNLPKKIYLNYTKKFKIKEVTTKNSKVFKDVLNSPNFEF